MFYTSLFNKNRGEQLRSLYKSEEDLGAESLQKSEEAEILKGRKAEPIGSRKNWGGVEYVKTAQGWSAAKKVKEAHDTIHGTNDPEAKYKVKLSNGAEADLRKDTAKLKDLSKEDHEKLADAHNALTAHKHTESAEAKVYHANQRDAHREAAKNSSAKKYSPADLPKDGTEIHVHAPAMGGLKAADFSFTYDKENFRFNVFDSTGKKLGHATEKQILDNLDLGHYQLTSKKEGAKEKELTPDEHRAKAQKHLENSQNHSFAGRYEESHKETVEARKHLAHAIGKEKDKFNAVLNNPEIEHVVISSKNPLSTQLRKITGDSYNDSDFSGSAGLGGVLTHNASGKKFTVISEDEAPIVKQYQEKNKPEASFDADEVSKTLKEHTAANNHTESLQHLASALGNKEAKEKLDVIAKKQEKAGYLTHDLSGERHAIYKELLSEVKEKHGEEVYKKIHGSL